MIQLQITQGSADRYPIRCKYTGGESDAVFQGTDILEAYVYRGQTREILFRPVVGWFTWQGTQLGYPEGEVEISVDSNQSQLLEQNGTYLGSVDWRPRMDMDSSCIASFTLTCTPGPGDCIPTIRPYCRLKDVLMFASWIETLQGTSIDQEGFYTQRLMARHWMDQAIINNYRGTSQGAFEYHSALAFAWGGGIGWRRSLGPSPAMLQWLADDQLVLRPQIVEACAHKTASIIGLSQIGQNNRMAQNGAYHREMATRCLIGTTAEIDLQDTGVGTIFVNLGSSNVLFT